MVMRVCITWITCFALIMAYEAVYHIYLKDKKTPASIMFMASAFLPLIGLFYYVASGFLGAFALLYYWPASNGFPPNIKAGIGLLAGMWLLSVLLQLCLNGLRISINVTPQRLHYINKEAWMFFRKRSRK